MHSQHIQQSPLIFFSYDGKQVSTWFGTGGAGFCISRHLADKMKKFILDNEFKKLTAKVGHADDVMIGSFVIKMLLNNNQFFFDVF